MVSNRANCRLEIWWCVEWRHPFVDIEGMTARIERERVARRVFRG